MTFEIKVSTRLDKAPLKLKVSEHEDKVITVRDFCKAYKIPKDKEEIIRNEVIKYFEKRAHPQNGGNQINNSSSSRASTAALQSRSSTPSMMQGNR